MAESQRTVSEELEIEMIADEAELRREIKVESSSSENWLLINNS